MMDLIKLGICLGAALLAPWSVAWAMGPAHQTWSCRASAGEWHDVQTISDGGSCAGDDSPVASECSPATSSYTPSPIYYDSDSFPAKAAASADALNDCREHAGHSNRCSLSGCHFNP